MCDCAFHYLLTACLLNYVKERKLRRNCGPWPIGMSARSASVSPLDCNAI